MIDINLIRTNPEVVKQSQINRGKDPNIVDKFLKLDLECQQLRIEVEQRRHEANVLSRKIGAMK